MSRSVRSTGVLPVPECPPVLCRMDHKRDICPLGENSAPFGMIRPSFLVVLWLIRSCFYLQERFTVEPANMIQLSKYYRAFLFVVRKSGNPCPFLFIPALKDGAF